MTLRIAGGLAALICAATYRVGFVMLVTVFAPLGFGSGDVDTAAAAVVAFNAARPDVMIAWNTVIYIVNALALAVLVVALRQQIAVARADAAVLTGTLGVIWATLVLGAGMIANVAVVQTYALTDDPEAAAALWQTLHAVELGLGGGNEIAGGAWILAVSLAALKDGTFGRVTAGIGVLSGAAGLLTILPRPGDIIGAVFGLGAIAWFVAVSVALLRVRQKTLGKRVAA